MDYSHLLTGFVSVVLSLAGGYALLRKQMVATKKDQVAVDKDQVAVDKDRADLDAGVEAAASAAWQKLFDRCEAERLETKKELDQLRKDFMELRVQGAERAAQITVLRAQVARLERDYPAGQIVPMPDKIDPKA